MGENRANSTLSRLVLMLLDLTGKKILVTGIANNRSIAWGIAQQLKAAVADLGITYLPDEKGRFESKVRELTAPLEPSLFLPLNVQDPDQMASVFAEIKVRFCISEDRRFLVYVMRSGKSWALPFDRDYRQAGVVSMNTIENEKLIHYTKKKGVVKRVILGEKRLERPVLY